MGFRDLPLFNEAMLGKQGWWLITRPESLCAQVLKGKYYPNGDFLAATRKKKSSETWRAILHGRKVLQKGMVKRVGPGDSINIWRDNWIWGLKSMKPLAQPGNVTVQRVDELFVQGTRQWNESLIRQSFMAIDADEIMKIRPGVRMEEDVIAWNYEKSGIYTVRSAYRLLKSVQSQEEASKRSESSSSDSSWMWRKVWKLTLPPKIHIFWWQVANNFLPTKEVLFQRHVDRETVCATCGAADETLFHIAFECSMARRFWEEVKKLTGIKVPRLHQVSWAKDLLTEEHCPRRTVEPIICGVWSLWSGRNARKHDRQSWKPATAARHVSAMLEDFICRGTESTSSRAGARGCWSRPPNGWTKVNTDAAFSPSTGAGSTGVVVRDERGEILAAAARSYSSIADALMAEALAVRDGVLLAVEQGVPKVILESDNMTVYLFFDQMMVSVASLLVYGMKLES